MKRPKISEENNDLLDQVNYLIEMDKYCDYLEEQNKQLSIHGVVSSKNKKQARECLDRLERSLENDFEGVDLNEWAIVKKTKPHLFNAFWQGYNM